MTADEEDEVARFQLGFADEGGERFGGHGLAGGIEKYLSGSCVAGEEIEPGGLDLMHLAGHVARSALDELLRHAVGVDVARFADVVDD